MYTLHEKWFVPVNTHYHHIVRVYLVMFNGRASKGGEQNNNKSGTWYDSYMYTCLSSDQVPRLLLLKWWWSERDPVGVATGTQPKTMVSGGDRSYVVTQEPHVLLHVC